MTLEVIKKVWISDAIENYVINCLIRYVCMKLQVVMSPTNVPVHTALILNQISAIL